MGQLQPLGQSRAALCQAQVADGLDLRGAQKSFGTPSYSEQGLAIPQSVPSWVLSGLGCPLGVCINFI